MNEKDEWVSMVPISAYNGEGISELVKLTGKYWKSIKEKNLDKYFVFDVLNIRGQGICLEVFTKNINNLRKYVQKSKNIKMSGLYKNITVSASRYIENDDLSLYLPMTKYKDLVKQVLPGSPIYMEDSYMEEKIVKILNKYQIGWKKKFKYIDKNKQKGVYIKCDTISKYEALSQACNYEKIPIHGFSLGMILEKDLLYPLRMKKKNQEEYAVILVYSERIPECINKEIKIIYSKSIYEIIQQYQKYLEDLKFKEFQRNKDYDYDPCLLKIYSQYIFNAKNPIILGVRILDGYLKIGTPIITSISGIYIGNITKIKEKDSDICEVGKNKDVSIEISTNNKNYEYGKTFDSSENLLSLLSRKYLDFVKKNSKDKVIQHIKLFKSSKTHIYNSV